MDQPIIRALIIRMRWRLNVLSWTCHCWLSKLFSPPIIQNCHRVLTTYPMIPVPTRSLLLLRTNQLTWLALIVQLYSSTNEMPLIHCALDTKPIALCHQDILNICSHTYTASTISKGNSSKNKDISYPASHNIVLTGDILWILYHHSIKFQQLLI